MISLPYELNMYPGGLPTVVHVNQYDDDFSIVFTLVNTYGTFTLQTGTTAEIRGTKRDGNGYDADCTIDIANSKVTVTGAAQMTAVAGQNTFEIVLKKSNKVLSTANFILDVEPAAMDAGTITSDTVLKELNAIIAGAAEATQAAEDASDAADRAEAAAQTLEIDDTLTQEGQAADAKATGDAVSELSSAISEIEPGLSNEARTALLACFEHVAWIDDDARDYYDALEEALYPGLTHISAVFNQGQNVIFTDDSLDILHQYLTVTAHYNDSTTEVVTNYTLEGTLSEGTSTITVVYRGKTTTFNATVTNIAQYLVYEIPSGTDISSTPMDTGITVFGADDDFTILAKARVNTIPSDTLQKYLVNHGTVSSGTLRLGLSANNNQLLFVTNVMHNSATVSASAVACDVMWVARVHNKQTTRILYVDNNKLVDASEDITSYISSRDFTGTYKISTYSNTSDTNGCFPGVVNLFRIYNTALQDADIESIMGITI